MIGWDVDTIPLGQKRVKPQNQVLVPVEELGDAADDTGGIDLVGFEGFHYFEEFVVDVWSVTEYDFYLV